MVRGTSSIRIVEEGRYVEVEVEVEERVRREFTARYQEIKPGTCYKCTSESLAGKKTKTRREEGSRTGSIGGEGDVGGVDDEER
jgi:formate dehydrogenase assembly factor FdhD